MPSWESHFNFLVCENIAPSKAEVVQINGLITEAEAGIEELSRQLTEHRRQIDVCRTVLSHTRLLPPELLAEIFVFYVQAAHSRDGLPPPLLFALLGGRLRMVHPSYGLDSHSLSTEERQTTPH